MRTKNPVQSIAEFVKGPRQYTTEGSLVFDFSIDGIDHYDKEPFHLTLALMKLETQFQVAIEEVDKQYPWEDDATAEQGPFGSRMRFLFSKPRMILSHSFGSMIMRELFYFAPKSEKLRKGQVYAYEQYVAKIAEELSKRDIPRIQIENDNPLEGLSQTSPVYDKLKEAVSKRDQLLIKVREITGITSSTHVSGKFLVK